MEREYKDIDGRPVSLDTLCRNEPAWAVNSIRRLEAECERLREALREADAPTLQEGWTEHETDWAIVYVEGDDGNDLRITKHMDDVIVETCRDAPASVVIYGLHRAGLLGSPGNEGTS